MIEDSEDEKSFNEESVDFDVLPGPGVSNILTQEDVEDQPFIVYLSQILTLAKMHYLQNCQIKSCTEQVSVEKVVVKSALYLTWVCVNYFIKKYHAFNVFRLSKIMHVLIYIKIL